MNNKYQYLFYFSLFLLLPLPTEFYYFSRDNINESHDVNILIDSDKNTIGNEFFIDIQKMVKTNDDKDKKNTLSFSLSGIKFTKV